MAVPGTGFDRALRTAADLDAFGDEVMEHNPEYTRGIVELIINGFMIIDEGDDLGCDDIREYVINAGRAIHPY